MRTIFTADQIAERVETMAADMTADLGANFTLVPILTGGFMFAADLARALHRSGADPEIDFIQLSSYGTGRISSGEVQLVKDVSAPVEDLTVVVVDDVLDTGRSLHFAKELFEARGALRVLTCVAVDKRKKTEGGLTADYRLFDISEDAFLVGYGMDDAGGQRGMPSIGAVND